MRWKVALIGAIAGAAAVFAARYHPAPLPAWANGSIGGFLVAGALAILLF